MIKNIENIKRYSTSTDIDFMFIAEYLNGTLFYEYNSLLNQYYSIKELNKNKLIHFGTIGNGLLTYFDVATGSFYFDGHKIEMYYKTNNEIINLTNQMILYNDIIYYKDAYSSFNTKTKKLQDNCIFCGYNLGYKIQFNYKNYKINFKPIISIQDGQPIHFKIWLVSNQDINGRLTIVVDDVKKYEYETPLNSNVGGEFSWIIPRL